MNRLMTNILSERLIETKAFYTKLFDFDVNYESDWFIHLLSKDSKSELGIIEKKNEIIPQKYQDIPKGIHLTFVVDDVDHTFELAKSLCFTIEKEPEDAFYGQRRLLLIDPNGLLIDVSSPIPDFKFNENINDKI